MGETTGAPDPKEADKVIGHNILTRRDRLKWSRKELADRISASGLKMNPQVIYNLEAGERALKMSEATTVAEVLGVQVDDLLPGRSQNVINRNYLHAVDAGQEYVAATEKLAGALERVDHDVRSSVHLRENFFGFGEESEDSARIRLREGSPIAIAERALLVWIVEAYGMADLASLQGSNQSAAEILGEVVADQIYKDSSLADRWWYKDLQRLASFREAMSRMSGEGEAPDASAS